MAVTVEVEALHAAVEPVVNEDLQVRTLSSEKKAWCILDKDGDEIVYRSLKPLPPLAHSNLASFILQDACIKYETRTAMVNGATGDEYTYGELREWVASTAAGLTALGVKQHDVVLVLSPNLPEFPVIYLAVLFLGAIVAPSNPLGMESDIVKQVKQSNARFVVTVPEQLSKFQTFGRIPIILIEDAGAENIPAYPQTQANDTCTLLFSSGTTGLSKAVQLTHENFISAITAYNTLEPGQSTMETDVCLAIIPMFHVYGLGIVMLATLERGASVVIMPRYSLPQMLSYIEKYRITVATIVPPIIVSLVKSAEVAKYDLSSLRIIATGAASLRQDTMEACATMFPQCILRQGYGMTELPLISFSVVEKERLQWGSVGVLVPGIEVRVTDVETGRALPPLASGELWIRAPMVMTGYLNNPEATAATKDSQGWLHTGDLGHVDTNGLLFIVDRLKEIIKYKANQVAPGELESIMLTHPSILDVAVIPIPDEEAGELPCAYVVRREGTDINEIHVMDFVGKQVAPYKKVRKVIFTESIPKSTTGKILRRILIERHHRTQ
ncbi:unnamed protein product [Sphagnum troendelagicum]|uniref:4-coumarate--CoA ligase n=1 Tax=Sphagnum jensenii TaxID=128206 RepID=A0ABP0VRS2_9BRYO